MKDTKNTNQPNQNQKIRRVYKDGVFELYINDDYMGCFLYASECHPLITKETYASFPYIVITADDVMIFSSTPEYSQQVIIWAYNQQLENLIKKI